jgi:E3 ubiquitin-protein ligase TRIP12
LIKAKAKAERAAARQVSQAPLVAAMLISAPASMSTPPVEEGSVPEAGSVELQTQDGEDPEPNPMPKEAAPDRTELLRSKSAVVGRFMQLMVPILIDVYAASVITPVRVKTLTGLLKAVSFLDADGLKRVLTVRCNLCL